MDRVTIVPPNGDDAFEVPYGFWRNHPHRGVDFPDTAAFTTDAVLARRAVEALAHFLPAEVEMMVGIDVGGFAFAAALAYRQGLGFIDVRKIGGIRTDVMRNLAANYHLGDGVAMSKAANVAGKRVALFDDVLISGGTALSSIQLLRRLGACCEMAIFVYDIEAMGGRERLEREGVEVRVLKTVPQTIGNVSQAAG